MKYTFQDLQERADDKKESFFLSYNPRERDPDEVWRAKMSGQQSAGHAGYAETAEKAVDEMIRKQEENGR